MKKYIFHGYMIEYGESSRIYTSDPYNTIFEAEEDAESWPSNFSDYTEIEEIDYENY